MNAFLDGRLELNNNLAERTVKPFVIGRKNWLFSNTPAGADASCILYSIIETAKMNELIPYEYIKYVLDEIPKDRPPSESEIENLFYGSPKNFSGTHFLHNKTDMTQFDHANTSQKGAS